MDKATLKAACDEYFPDMELIGSGNTDYGHNLADAILNQREQEDLEKRANLAYDLDFVDEVKKLGINMNDYYSDLEAKQKLIRKHKGYTLLNGEGKEKKTLAQCSRNSQLGRAFQNMYNASCKKINAS